MKITKLTGQYLDRIRPAICQTGRDIVSKWHDYEPLADFPCTVDNGGGMYLAGIGIRPRWAPPAEAEIFPLEDVLRGFLNAHGINIYAGTQKIPRAQNIHSTVILLLQKEPLNPTARLLAAQSIPETSGIFPEELKTWEEIKTWLDDGIVIELPPLPESVMDLSKSGMAFIARWTRKRVGVRTFVERDETRDRYHLTYTELKKLASECKDAEELTNAIEELLGERVRNQHNDYDSDGENVDVLDTEWKEEEEEESVEVSDIEPNGLLDWIHVSLPPEIKDKYPKANWVDPFEGITVTTATNVGAAVEQEEDPDPEE